jgi:uncharacterized membrane protein YesL
LNFKIATLLWLTVLIIAFILFFNIQNSALLGSIGVYLAPVHWALAITLFLTAIYLFPLLSRFTMGYKQLFKTAFFLAYRHILSTVLCIAVLTATLLIAIVAFFPLLLIGAGIYAYATSFLFMRVFRKYRSEIDSAD